MSETNSDKIILDVDGACNYLNASRSTIYKLAQTSGLPCQKVGRQWRFNRDELDRWIANRGAAPSVSAAPAACGKALNRPTSAHDAASAVSPPPSAHAAPSSPRAAAPSLGAFFDPPRLATLRTFGCSSPMRFVSMMATSTGRAGLQALLSLSAEELDRVAQEITKSFFPDDGGV